MMNREEFTNFLFEATEDGSPLKLASALGLVQMFGLAPLFGELDDFTLDEKTAREAVEQVEAEIVAILDSLNEFVHWEYGEVPQFEEGELEVLQGRTLDRALYLVAAKVAIEKVLGPNEKLTELFSEEEIGGLGDELIRYSVAPTMFRLGLEQWVESLESDHPELREHWWLNDCGLERALEEIRDIEDMH